MRNLKLQEKILTISTAAYNAEQYISRALDSLTASDFIDRLEILVIDDGGSDSTGAIALEYAERFPDSVFFIHKENGGYGSTVNCGIARATGKYFKLLDGDDWFDTEGLDRLVAGLEKTSADAVITDYLCGPDPDNMKLMRKGSSAEGIRSVDEIDSVINHWALTYRTDFLRETGITLPEHCLYTDRYYSAVPLAQTGTVAGFAFPVYCYNLGRNGQSVSRECRIKHCDEHIRVTEMICEFTENYARSGAYLKMRACSDYRYSVKTILLPGFSRTSLEKLEEFEERMRGKAPQIYAMAGSSDIRTGKMISYIRSRKYRINPVLRALHPEKLFFK